MMNDIFREYLDHFVVIYLDDILVFSLSMEEHTHHVRLILSKLREHELYAKREKCDFDRNSVEFLGYVISPRASPWIQGKSRLSKNGPIQNE